MNKASQLLSVMENGNAKKGDWSTDDLDGDMKRNGTWMEPHHVAHAAANPEKTEKMYRIARNQTNIADEEKFLAMVFNNPEFAENVAIRFYDKELRGGVTSVDDVEEISKSLMDGFASDGNPSHATYQVRSDARTPEDIIEVQQIVNLLFKEIDKEWPGRPLNKLVLTYNLIRGRFDHLFAIDFQIPMYDECNRIIDDIEKEGRDWESAYIFQEKSGISRKMYETVVAFLHKKAQEYGVELMQNTGYYDRRYNRSK